MFASLRRRLAATRPASSNAALAPPPFLEPMRHEQLPAFPDDELLVLEPPEAC